MGISQLISGCLSICKIAKNNNNSRMIGLPSLPIDRVVISLAPRNSTTAIKTENMGKLLNIVTSLHKSSKRDYLARMIDDKVHCMNIAKQYGKDYWDGDRRYGYGGYKYMPGRWKPVAEKLISIYNLKPGSKVLDIGCGKGYLIYEMNYK